MSKKIILACMAIAAFAAFALPASASASPRLCETAAGGGEPCTNVAVGSLIKGTNVGNWTFTGEGGNNVVCSVVTMTGNLTENSGTSTKGDITSTTFGGTGTNGDCTGPLGTSVQVITNEGNGLPWCLSANNEMAADEFQVRGNACNLASRSITFQFNITGLNHCWYNRTGAVKGTFTTDTAGQDAVLTFSEQEWTLEKEERTSIFAPACPGFGKLDGAATLETDPVSGATEPLYIK
jgi:hypothetical protein